MADRSSKESVSRKIYIKKLEEDLQKIVDRQNHGVMELDTIQNNQKVIAKALIILLQRTEP